MAVQKFAKAFGPENGVEDGEQFAGHGDQADLKKRIKEIAEAGVRYGYRHIHVLFVREGWP